MSVFSNIQIALDSRLDAGSFGLSIAYENIDYTPVESTSFIRPTTLYGSAEVADVARLEKFSGIYQIDVFVEVEKGPGALNTLLDSIRDHFKSNLSLTAGSDTIMIRSIGRTSASRDRAWYQGSVEVAFDCYTI